MTKLPWARIIPFEALTLSFLTKLCIYISMIIFYYIFTFFSAVQIWDLSCTHLFKSNWKGTFSQLFYRPCIFSKFVYCLLLIPIFTMIPVLFTLACSLGYITWKLTKPSFFLFRCVRKRNRWRSLLLEGIFQGLSHRPKEGLQFLSVAFKSRCFWRYFWQVGFYQASNGLILRYYDKRSMSIVTTKVFC